MSTSVAMSLKEDETAVLSSLIAPIPHYLESWDDNELLKGTYSITQPLIRPLFNTKQFQEVLLSLNGIAGSYYDYIKASASSALSGTNWNKVLHDGIFVIGTPC